MWERGHSSIMVKGDSTLKQFYREIESNQPGLNRRLESSRRVIFDKNMKPIDDLIYLNKLTISRRISHKYIAY